MIVGADLESELLDVQIDPRSHELAHGGASWSIELYRAEGSRSQCDRLWGWGAEVQIGTGLRSLVPPVQRGRKCFSQRRPISVMRASSSTFCAVLTVSLCRRSSRCRSEPARDSNTGVELLPLDLRWQGVSSAMGWAQHGRGSRTGWRDAVEHDDQHITQQRGAHGHRSLIVRRHDTAACSLHICGRGSGGR